MFKVEINEKIIKIAKEDGEVLFEYNTLVENASFNIYGVFGLLKFNSLSFLILITKAQRKGEVEANPVYEVLEAKTIPIETDDIKQNRRINAETLKLTKLIESFFTQPGLYFCDFPIFKRYEIKTNANNTKKELGKNQSNDDKDTLFLFNKQPLDNLIDKTGIDFNNSLLLKCIQGYFYMWNDLILISRRSPKRIGTRYFSRGVDEQGHPSNLVETEQIISGNSSFVQLRGSIPLRWHHIISLRYRPIINILPSHEPFESAHKILTNMYELPIIYLNLIDDIGYEANLHKNFGVHANLNTKAGIRLYNFNFKRDLYTKAYPLDFTSVGFNSVKNSQVSIIRTNCIDCLDRTNSMQYLIGAKMLVSQLKDAGIHEKDKQKAYEAEFKQAFYTNGNYLSLQYAGTNAMSSKHITSSLTEQEQIQKHKKKTILNKIRHLLTIETFKDCQYSLQRYFINRFRHGQYHTVLNIVTGNKTVGGLHKQTRTGYTTLMNLAKYILIVSIVLMTMKKFKPSKKIAVILLIVLLLFLSNIEYYFDIPENED